MYVLWKISFVDTWMITSATFHKALDEPTKRTRAPRRLDLLKGRTRQFLLTLTLQFVEVRQRVELLVGVDVVLGGVGEEPDLLGEPEASLLHVARVEAAQGHGGALGGDPCP